MKNRFIILVAIIGTLVPFSCKNNVTPSGELYKVEGIIEGKNGPIEGAKVQIDDSYNFSSITDSNGSFEINDVSKGEHQIQVTKDYDSSFVERSYTITVETDLILEAMRLPSALILLNEDIRQTLTSDMIDLNWSQSDAEDFREYKIYRHTSSGLDESTGELIHVSTFRGDTVFTDSIPHFSTYYYRLYQMNEYGRLGGSNIVKVSSEEYKNIPLVYLNEINLRYLNQGETLWLYFPVVSGEIYKITWDHIEWEIDFPTDLSCFREDKTTHYFENEVILPHLSGPKTILAEANENVYLKIKSQVPGSNGIFRIQIDNLSYKDALQINLDTEYDISVDVGESKLIYFVVDANSKYEINSISSKNSSDIYVKITGFEREYNSIYFYEKLTGSNIDPVSFTINALNTGPVYFIITGGYYFYDTSIKLNVRTIN
jgi:hypothetical protein